MGCVRCEPHHMVNEACRRYKIVLMALCLSLIATGQRLQGHEMKCGRHKVKPVFLELKAGATEDCLRSGQPTTCSREVYASAVLASIKLWLSG